jgi:DNA-binding XRE family transcriptional regulator
MARAYGTNPRDIVNQAVLDYGHLHSNGSTSYHSRGHAWYHSLRFGPLERFGTLQQLMGFVTRRRKARKLSQRELGAMIGIQNPQICQYEREHHVPRLDTLIRMLDALDCDLVVVPRQEEASGE